MTSSAGSAETGRFKFVDNFLSGAPLTTWNGDIVKNNMIMGGVLGFIFTALPLVVTAASFALFAIPGVGKKTPDNPDGQLTAAIAYTALALFQVPPRTLPHSRCSWHGFRHGQHPMPDGRATATKTNNNMHRLAASHLFTGDALPAARGPHDDHAAHGHLGHQRPPHQISAGTGAASEAADYARALYVFYQKHQICMELLVELDHVSPAFVSSLFSYVCV